MSPELLIDDKASTKSDVWSFGVVLWEMLTEALPYTDLGLVEAGQAIVSGQQLEIPTYCPPAFAALIKDCWKMNPDERPDFGEIYDRLEVKIKTKIIKQNILLQRLNFFIFNKGMIDDKTDVAAWQAVEINHNSQQITNEINEGDDEDDVEGDVSTESTSEIAEIATLVC